jgi:hypothetical protein
MTTNFDCSGDGASWGPSSWYIDFEEKLRAAIESGDKFDTGYVGVKKEIQSFRIHTKDSGFVCEVSCSDDFDTEGKGEVFLTREGTTEEIMDKIRSALDSASNEADEDRKANERYRGFAIPKNGHWIETFIQDTGGYGDISDSPPGDCYQRWGWQADAAVPKPVRQAMEKWIYEKDREPGETFVYDDVWSIKCWEG